MFDEIKPFPKIIVTGPQRSGTRICAKMIAHDLGREYISEAHVGLNVFGLLKELVDDRTNFVVQCPGLSAHVHKLGDRDDTAIVFMRRSLERIRKSQERIKWGRRNERRELEEYGIYDLQTPIAIVKYEYWTKVQVPAIKHAFEIPYPDLADHPLWVPEHLRKDFTPGQTEVGKPEKYGPKSKRLGVKKRREYENRRD